MRNLTTPDFPGSFVRYDVPLAPFSTWGVGGLARMLLMPRTEEELLRSVNWIYANDADFFILGGGSNVLISDLAVEIPVISTAAMSGFSFWKEGGKVYINCMSGTPMKDVLALTVKNGWSGLEFMAGIPGTVGGAVAGNAGSRYGSVGSCVERIITIGSEGESISWAGDKVDWNYRKCSLFKDGRRIARNVIFRVTVSTREEVARKVAESMKSRKNQPVWQRTAGCVFENPPGKSAGKLLDEAGCKGMSAGGAKVSDTHANFIENHGGSARDILSLVLSCRRRVFQKFGVYLEMEIKMTGIWEVSLDACA